MVAAKKDKLTGDALGTGRRKTAVARVRLRAGSGVVTINDRTLEDYFSVETDRMNVVDALEVTGHRADMDVIIRVAGGGPTGQSGAIRMGIARALLAADTESFNTLRGGGYLTRDSRMKERKHYGLRGARRGTQFSKR
ncbi:30S ribosomal protein S9 [Anatilimnocola aggregata]|uniref:Small ribosomal subunit protein uS9 n=1 Tax=Anatilimnocola aggregata TaxID=2528021 RepID=A0A517YKZ1_9BACT|nr:30S ribosomal protein S9 [Anatilimnocola aggregata]QDU30899.1 30S ribosomal protein S9 [Anatilimnocola aggregata]